MTTPRTIGPDSEIEFLLLPSRAYSALRRRGIDKIADLLVHSPASITRIRGIGVKSSDVIEARLRELGLKFQPHAHR